MTKRILYGKVFNMGDYTNERIYLEDEFERTTSDTDAIKYLKARVDEMHEALKEEREANQEEINLKMQINQMKELIESDLRNYGNTNLRIEQNKKELVELQAKLELLKKGKGK